MTKTTSLNIVLPLAGAGSKFIQAGYSFPKPLIDIEGKPMVQLVTENIKPKHAHKFLFICKKEHYDQYSLHEIFRNSAADDYEVIQLLTPTQGAACTVLTAVDYINNDEELIVANSDQIIDVVIDDFIDFARKNKLDGAIMTFRSSHPRWSYALADKDNNVIEVAEKKVISENATVGIYYFRQGKFFVEAATAMIAKDIRVNGEFYVCPVYNELIMAGKKVKIWPIKNSQMHSLGTPEDLKEYVEEINKFASYEVGNKKGTGR